METTSIAMDEPSTLEPTGSLVQTEPSSSQPAGSLLEDPADDWDLRALDVTAGEPD